VILVRQPPKTKEYAQTLCACTGEKNLALRLWILFFKHLFKVQKSLLSFEEYELPMIAIALALEHSSLSRWYFSQCTCTRVSMKGNAGGQCHHQLPLSHPRKFSVCYCSTPGIVLRVRRYAITPPVRMSLCPYILLPARPSARIRSHSPGPGTDPLAWRLANERSRRSRPNGSLSLQIYCATHATLAPAG